MFRLVILGWWTPHLFVRLLQHAKRTSTESLAPECFEFFRIQEHTRGWEIAIPHFYGPRVIKKSKVVSFRAYTLLISVIYCFIVIVWLYTSLSISQSLYLSISLSLYLSISLSLYLSISQSLNLSISLSLYLSISLSLNLSISLSLYLSISLSLNLSISLSLYLSISLSPYLSISLSLYLSISLSL